MRADVAQLLSDSGELLAIAGLASSRDRFSVLAFEFPSRTLVLRCDDDTDEIVLETIDRPGDYPAVSITLLTELVGMTVEYAWVMRNHRGYYDAFQLRLRDERGRNETRQFEVGASAMDVRRVAT